MVLCLMKKPYIYLDDVSEIWQLVSYLTRLRHYMAERVAGALFFRVRSDFRESFTPKIAVLHQGRKVIRSAFCVTT